LADSGLPASWRAIGEQSRYSFTLEEVGRTLEIRPERVHEIELEVIAKLKSRNTLDPETVATFPRPFVPSGI
jgi:DNA-directed RNA polymerase sigma subunit (sigma70/sigma32)